MRRLCTTPKNGSDNAVTVCLMLSVSDTHLQRQIALSEVVVPLLLHVGDLQPEHEDTTQYSYRHGTGLSTTAHKENICYMRARSIHEKTRAFIQTPPEAGTRPTIEHHHHHHPLINNVVDSVVDMAL